MIIVGCRRWRACTGRVCAGVGVAEWAVVAVKNRYTTPAGALRPRAWRSWPAENAVLIASLTAGDRFELSESIDRDMMGWVGVGGVVAKMEPEPERSQCADDWLTEEVLQPGLHVCEPSAPAADGAVALTVRFDGSKAGRRADVVLSADELAGILF